MSNTYSCNGFGGVRPLCHLESSISVSVPDEEGMQMNRGEAIKKARDAAQNTLNDYLNDIWGDVLGAASAASSSRNGMRWSLRRKKKQVEKSARPKRNHQRGLFKPAAVKTA